MELITEGLLRSHKLCVLPCACVLGKDRRTGEAEQVILLEMLDNIGMHITELRTMAFIEDDNYFLIIDIMLLVSLNKISKLLYRSDNDFSIRIL